MHPEAQEHAINVKRNLPQYFKKKRVLEVGSLNINGSIRDIFEDCDYTGIDLGEGPGVDVVSSIHEYIHPEEFDVVISYEALEHCSVWEQALETMYSNLKKGGILILTCAAPNRPEHGTIRSSPKDAPYTNDWYRNISIEDFSSTLPPKLFTNYHLGYYRNVQDLYFWGIKA